MIDENRYFCCQRKISYESRAQARSELKKMQGARSNSQGKAKGQEVYRCPYCAFWHIGRKISKARKRHIRGRD